MSMSDDTPETRDPLEFEPSGRSLLDMVLLAIIDGHLEGRPGDDESYIAKERQARLVRAKRILFGQSGQSGNGKVPDMHALTWMASYYEKACAEELNLQTARRAPSEISQAFEIRRRESISVKIAPIAQMAAKKFYPESCNAPSRLEKKFSASKNYWIERMYEADATDELCLVSATDFCELLRLTGVSGRLPTSYWD
jgi:hypothetical protein